MNLKILILMGVLLYSGGYGKRVRRHLVFNKGSRLFFSIDVRDNLFDYYKLFANVFGVKIDWELPDQVIRDPQRKSIQRRDLYHGIKYLMDRHNVNGTSCVQKFICEAVILLQKSDSFLAQLYEIIFTPVDIEDSGVIPKIEDCNMILESEVTEYCPFSLASLAHGYHPNIHLLDNFK